MVNRDEVGEDGTRRRRGEEKESATVVLRELRQTQRSLSALPAWHYSVQHMPTKQRCTKLSHSSYKKLEHCQYADDTIPLDHFYSPFSDNVLQFDVYEDRNT